MAVKFNLHHITDYATAKSLADRVMAYEEDGWLYEANETGAGSGRWVIDVYDDADKYMGTF